MTPEIDTTSSLPARTTRSARRIVHRTSGHPHGGITRLMSPGDLGELVKPFVFSITSSSTSSTFPSSHTRESRRIRR
jgi:hypothetical protein